MGSRPVKLFITHLGGGNDKLRLIYEEPTGKLPFVITDVQAAMSEVQGRFRMFWGYTTMYQQDLFNTMAAPELAEWNPTIIEGFLQAHTNAPTHLII